MKRIFLILICVSVFALSLPVFSFAATPDVYSSLPEPYPDSSVRYFAIDLDGAYSLYMITAAGGIKDVTFSLSSNKVVIDVNTELGNRPQATVYNLYTGELRQNTFNFGTQVGSSSVFEYKFSNFDVTERTVRVFGYGCVFASGWSLDPLNVAWNDATDPSTYTSILNKINSKLNEVDTNTDNIETQLNDIQAELNLFYELFSSYSALVLGDTNHIISQLNTIYNKLSSFSDTNHQDLSNIYNKLDDIYNLLNEEASTYAPADPDKNVDSYVEAESELMKDYSGELQGQFDSAGEVFVNNSSYGFISDTFTAMILGHNSLNSLIIFALAIGLCVLVLGRRLNA